MLCPQCQVTLPEGARFCEACGVNLSPPGAAVSTDDSCRCGAGPDAKGEDGFCAACGLRWPVPRIPLPRDHVEWNIAPGFAAVSDRGKRHTCNEDDAALAQMDIGGQLDSILVVCDGVSSSQRADEASRAAAAAACASLQKAARQGGQSVDAMMRAAMRAAHEAACTLPTDPRQSKDPPGATIVAAVVRDSTATLGWLGDSRAYWISPNIARLLTHDHSWVNEVVDAGDMTEEDALRAPAAHAITRCLGPLNGSAPEPSLLTVPLTEPGWLLLCSDGLWNYVPQTEPLAALVRQAPADGDALDLCRRLVEYALAQGGRDNITVALLRVLERNA